MYQWGFRKSARFPFVGGSRRRHDWDLGLMRFTNSIGLWSWNTGALLTAEGLVPHKSLRTNLTMLTQIPLPIEMFGTPGRVSPPQPVPHSEMTDANYPFMLAQVPHAHASRAPYDDMRKYRLGLLVD